MSFLQAKDPNPTSIAPVIHVGANFELNLNEHPMDNPRVSIGLPVYNAERYLSLALDSLLQQTFRDFEIIISDNASTDETESICKEYVNRDSRIRYERNDKNLGAAANFNRVVDLARGEYFKWSAHDDIHLKYFLERCVHALDERKDAVLSFGLYNVIDEQGHHIRTGNKPVDTGLKEVNKRFISVMQHQLGAPMIWGLIRTEVLRSTPLIATYYKSDLVLLAELSLHGIFVCIPEDLFLHREHANRSVYTRSAHHYVRWLGSKTNKSSTLPMWRALWEYQRAVFRGPISWKDKCHCWVHTVRWLRRNWYDAWSDIVYLAKRCWPFSFLNSN